MNLARTSRVSRLPQRLGWTLLCVWLIAMGLIPLLGLGSPALSMLMHIVAIAAGVLLFLER
jgi:hypothetical protein